MKLSTRAALSATALTLFCLAAGRCAAAPEVRDRQWLTTYVTQPIADSEHNRRYLASINARLENSGARYLDLDVDWLERGGGEGYRARAQTNTIGALAFCWRTPGLKYHHDPVLLEKLRRAFLAVAAHVTEEGKFIWPGDKDMYWAGSHEHSWRLEPLLLGYIWVGDQFPQADRRVIEAMLDRAAGWLYRNPTTQHNNRGAVWCAITTLCGLYFDRPEYLAKVEQHAGDIMNSVVLADGEVGEHTGQYGGGGPCSNYSYTSIGYVYLYRLLSGNERLDDRLAQAARWFALYNTTSGFSLVAGASVRRAYAAPFGIVDTLPLLERYSRREPFLATMADLMMQRRSIRYFQGHIVSPLIWAMLETRATPPAEPPEWYLDHTGIYERPQVHYALVSRRYQTGITFRGRTQQGYEFNLRGLQTFAFGDESPVLLHTDQLASTFLADGIDTARTNVSRGPAGWEVIAQTAGAPTGAQGRLAVILERRSHLWTAYAFTPASVVVVYGGARGEGIAQWVMNSRFVAKPELDTTGRRLNFQDRKGRIFYENGSPRLNEETAAVALEVRSAAGRSAFAFSNESFQFAQENDADEVRFSDETGIYRLIVRNILDVHGDIDRTAPMRLQRVGDRP